MSYKSKISRSIIVLIFIATMIFFGYQNLMLGTTENSNKTPLDVDIPTWFKVVYVVAIILVVLLYVYLKERLYKKKVKRSTSLIIRYIYLIAFSGVVSFITLNYTRISFSNMGIVYLVLMSILTSVVVKKIIFNVSKSDILSVLGLTLTACLINVIDNKTDIYISRIILFSVVFSIYLMQIIIDELKQKGIKNKKYVFFSVFLGISSGISMTLGVNPVIYIGVYILIFLIGTNLDNAHITFSRKVTQGISKEKREFLYKLERINISKLLICVLITFCVAFLVLLGSYLLIKYTSIVNVKKDIVIDLINLFKVNKAFSFKFSLSNIIIYFRNISSMSKLYYMVFTVYILFMEILAFVLDRRYDTKSTVIKLVFMLTVYTMIFLGLNINYYQPLISVMFILISIVNTSNIYLNREERIKLLVAS